MNSPWPCGHGHKIVAKNHNAVCCNVCNNWLHISCNSITRYIYTNFRNIKHLGTVKNEFTEDYLVPLLEKLPKEDKETILMGDFNINILHGYSDRGFIDTGYSNYFYPTIDIPTRITSTSKTLALLVLQIMGELLDAFCPVTVISKRKQNLKTKPWIATALTTSMKIRDNIFKKFERQKN